ncbi:MAG TPA: DUF1015 domain-containing protein, partial [Candidatus Methylomirabilis sp.]|nr:DUF1015 domain-containing protein [Candidatus Methylomirabilis sp.]
ELAARSPYNVVQLDLPRDPDAGDPYEHAAELLERWKGERALVPDEPAIWALEQDYTAPDGRTHTRRGFLARVGLAPYGKGIRPHERTQPGPKEDRLRLTRATRHNLSPIFSLHPGDAWQHIAPALDEPWGEVTDGEGTTHRIWRVADPAVHRAVTDELAPGELLIADGHHRYETALAYQREVGEGKGADHVLMALVSLEDPGLTVFATHRLLKDLSEEQREAIRGLANQLYELEEVEEGELVPAPEDPPGSFGYMDAHHLKPWRLRPKAEAMRETGLKGSRAYRELDAAILEALFLKRAVGLSAEEIAAKKQLGYTPGTEEAVAKLRAGDYDAAFFLRPTPVEQVREVAAAGETMPPKSTYFFPKLLTGLAFNPLS